MVTIHPLSFRRFMRTVWLNLCEQFLRAVQSKMIPQTKVLKVICTELKENWAGIDFNKAVKSRIGNRRKKMIIKKKKTDSGLITSINAGNIYITQPIYIFFFKMCATRFWVLGELFHYRITCRNNSFGRVAWESKYHVGSLETWKDSKKIPDMANLRTLWVCDYNIYIYSEGD